VICFFFLCGLAVVVVLVSFFGDFLFMVLVLLIFLFVRISYLFVGVQGIGWVFGVLFALVSY